MVAGALEYGSAGVLILIIMAIWRGELRTRQEIEAWRERTSRAETLVDTLLPVVERQTDAIEKQHASIVVLAESVKRMTDMVQDMAVVIRSASEFPKKAQT